MAEPVRIVMLDPQWFGDVKTERNHFESLLETSVRVDGINCDSEAISSTVGKADILLTHETGVSAEAMDATDCSVIARYATGIDGIDIDAATDRGVRVTRVPKYCNEEVGTHILALALSLLRDIPAQNEATTAGEWDWQTSVPIRSIAEQTFGFLAFGQKARAAAEKAVALGFDCCAYDPYLTDEKISENSVEPVTFETLLETSDILSVNAPLTPETKNILGQDALGKLPPGAVVINTARGQIIDEDALEAHLSSGHLRAAGLDVFESEPPAPSNPLLHRDDVIATPHMAWYSQASASELRYRGTKIAVAALNCNNVRGIVNPDTCET